MNSESIDELRMLNRRIGRLQEREMIISILKDIALGDKYGDYVYLSDLQQYLDETDEL
tara:strand:- start:2253 stop:2426 length:174 start_codon:yes stop_codon:yes gene_type:complete